jgi:hypothetical protein
MADPEQPVLILGGFLITPEAYSPMVQVLSRCTGQPVQLVEVTRPQWLLTLWAVGWARILDRVATLATELAQASPTGKITLIGHSSGGILLRLFLSDLPFQGRRSAGGFTADRAGGRGPWRGLRQALVRKHRCGGPVVAPSEGGAR